MELIGTIPLLGGTLATAIAFVVALSVIVTIHEYGHYIVGRWCGIHAEVFSLGFGKVLMSRVDKRGTRWQLAAIPFGGYVKFLGDADASSRNDPTLIDAMDPQTRSKSFHGAALYKKALTVAAGPVANFLLSILVFAGLVFSSGLSTELPTIGKVLPIPQATTTLKMGDVILSVNGVPTTDYTKLYDYAREADAAAAQTYEIKRGDDVLSVAGPFPLLPLIESVQPQSAAMAAGLQPGDFIMAINGEKLTAFSDLMRIVSTSDGKTLDLSVWRDGQVMPFTLTAKVSDIPDGQGGFTRRALIGVGGSLFFEPMVVNPTAYEALEIGVRRTGFIMENSLVGLYSMIKGKISACNLQGPIGMAGIAGDTARQGLPEFINFIAVLSTAIGLLNLFPIPVLDGGHLVFFAYEAVARRKPNERVMNILMTGGLILVMGLMVFALTQDFLCRIFSWF